MFEILRVAVARLLYLFEVILIIHNCGSFLGLFFYAVPQVRLLEKLTLKLEGIKKYSPLSPPHPVFHCVVVARMPVSLFRN